MEGSIARLPELMQVARDHDAVLIMDDSHATGVLGETGRGTAEHFGVLGEVDVITSTLGKALGGAAGGFVAGPSALCDTLTQRSRPQLFSNALPPTVAASALASIEFIEAHPERVRTLRENTALLPRRHQGGRVQAARRRHADRPDHHRRDGGRDPHERDAAGEGIFVTGFGFPVVPHGTARLRCQISAAHTRGSRGARDPEGRARHRRHHVSA
jgi:glycine C-acetyltransferase